ncbi:V-type H+-transporting ATPase 16kDa proteolipid subunit [Entomortierella parvispora]|uniref:V-type proton ATPase subunit C n=1 Tax=Entomortierella parvispora TaxID=205924 RepID=A0A9P3LUZ1_9FUNG|nr:V-type H+-transporting ATPase 16kDa proteolipid subunit [Entomortierella parvispora]
MSQRFMLIGLEKVDEEEFVPVVEIQAQTDETFQEQDEEQEAPNELEQDEQDGDQVQEGDQEEELLQRRRGRKKTKPNIKLPDPPEFEPLVQNIQPGYVNLDPVFQGTVPPPIALFRFFFTDFMLDTIVRNTNLYAENKRTEAGATGRAWKSMTRNELVTWIAITIYIGLHKMPSLVQLWNTERVAPTHYISMYMNQVRYEQIKRYFHVCAPDAVVDEYCDKVEPLLSHIRDTSKRYYTPASNVSIDEMMIRFSGRSAHTVRMKNKPIAEGVKIFSLCDAGYTYTFIPSSRVQSVRIEKVPGLTQTGNIVNHLVQQLPQSPHYRVFMDNYFTSVKLFQHFRNLGIGACGTVRRQGGVPKELCVDKNAKLDWDTRSGVVVGGVLVVFWMDNGPVTMMTTIHGMIGDEWEVMRVRRRPRETSTNGTKVRSIFGNEPKKELKILKVIDDYNVNMGGVDIVDQLRSYYSTQQSAHRNWWPIFFWLLDTTIINCYLIARKKGSILTHREFRSSLVWGLIDSVTTTNITKRRKVDDPVLVEEIEGATWRRPRVTKTFTLPNDRFTDDSHFPVTRKERSTCLLCSWKAKNKLIFMDHKSPVQSNICPVYAPFFGVMGATSAIVFCCFGAAYGTAKSGVGLTSMGVLRPDLIMKGVVPIIMAGIIGIYGLVVSVLIGNGFSQKMSLYAGFIQLGAGLSVGLAGMAAGFAVGIVGDAGVRASAQQPRLFTGMILVLIFAEVLALYGLIVALILNTKASDAAC